MAMLLFGQAPAQAIPWPEPSAAGIKVVDGKLQVSGDNNDELVVLQWRKPRLPSHRFVLKTHASGHARQFGVLKATLQFTTKSGESSTVIVQSNDTGGPMARLEGGGFSSDFKERLVELPFVIDPDAQPNELKVELYFGATWDAENKGSITFDSFTVEPWPRWSLTSLAAGLYAAALGVAFGLIAGIYGLLAAVPNSRRFAFGFGKVIAYLGVAVAAVGPCLYFASFPYGIWLPTLVAGLVASVVFGGTLPMVKKGIESADRMRVAADPSLEPA